MSDKRLQDRIEFGEPKRSERAVDAEDSVEESDAPDWLRNELGAENERRIEWSLFGEWQMILFEQGWEEDS